MLCKFCPDKHKYVCNCGHSHAEHNFAGGCRHKTDNVSCACEGYDQSKRILNKQEVKE